MGANQKFLVEVAKDTPGDELDYIVSGDRDADDDDEAKPSAQSHKNYNLNQIFLFFRRLPNQFQILSLF